MVFPLTMFKSSRASHLHLPLCLYLSGTPVSGASNTVLSWQITFPKAQASHGRQMKQARTTYQGWAAFRGLLAKEREREKQRQASVLRYLFLPRVNTARHVASDVTFDSISLHRGQRGAPARAHNGVKKEAVPHPRSLFSPLGSLLLLVTARNI